MISLFFLLFAPLFSEIPPLDSLPKADEQKIVLSSKVISIPHAQFPFNASLVKKKNKNEYWLFFREELKGIDAEHVGGSRLGVLSLNRQFDPISPPRYPLYPIFGKSVEDPRAFWIGDSLYLLYCVYPRPAPATLCLVKIDTESLEPQLVHLLSHERCPEKNWVPLLSKEDTSTLVCVRNLFPIDTVQIDLDDQTVLFSSNNSEIKRSAPSSWKWGTLSGGTQAESLGDRYLCFFHSWFLEQNQKRTYVLGACTFDKKAPFAMKEISPYPILFKELYTAKALDLVGNPFGRKWAQNLQRVIFPCSFLEEKLPSGKELFHVSCGENDNSIRVITFDKEALLKSLIPLNTGA